MLCMIVFPQQRLYGNVQGIATSNNKSASVECVAIASRYMRLAALRWQVSSTSNCFKCNQNYAYTDGIYYKWSSHLQPLYLSNTITHNGNTHSIMLKLHQSSRPNTYVFVFSHVHEERTFSTIALAGPWGHPTPPP